MRKPRSVPPNFTVFVKGCLHHTNARTAEMCKLTENSSRDVQIAFANELSLICDRAGINVWELISLANKHPRVNILQPDAASEVIVLLSTRILLPPRSLWKAVLLLPPAK